MEEIDWFVHMLKSLYQKSVDREDIGYEGIELYLDEIDEALIPADVLEPLPEFLLFETMLYVDEEGKDWLGAIALHPETNEWCLQVILHHGKTVYRKRLKEE
ncbi:hypothetical protein [Bacillus piscicola]|uniref:hypothetical protein n=1 Tax=Bacillus piscicola TaxID=1632684 RepID=UPI001F096A72|nr:hypothetical protein [Bacillus piscicola]